jgi:hypothetical protein
MHAQVGKPWKVVEYDAIRRRLWILGQRCHHGATGSLFAAFGCAALIAESVRAASASVDGTLLAMTVTGGVMMVHDWHDRAFWFERGRGTQP